MSNLISIWGESLLSFTILILLPVGIPFFTVQLLKKRNMVNPKRSLIVSLSIIAELLIITIPWYFILKDGIGEWMLLLLFFFGITIFTLGPVAILVFIIRITQHKQKNERFINNPGEQDQR